MSGANVRFSLFQQGNSAGAGVEQAHFSSNEKTGQRFPTFMESAARFSLNIIFSRSRFGSVRPHLRQEF